MARLPDISGDVAAKAFSRAGFDFDHQTGSHMILRSQTIPRKHLSIPRHKELGKGLLCGLVRDAGLTVEEFINLL
jgi:predicted RNA binding protein YcfA (HicA-like mRNA interferase family)